MQTGAGPGFNIQSGNMHMLNTFHRPLLGFAAAVLSLASLGAHAASQYKVTNIGLPTGSTYFSPFAINDTGAIAGIAGNTTGNRDAFLWSGGTFTNLGALYRGGGLNNAGTVVGQSASGQGVVVSQGKVTELPALAGASGAYPLGINQAGTIVGGSGGQAAIWKNGQVQPLGPVPSQGTSTLAVAINDSGVSIGSSGDFVSRPLLWSADGTVTELENPPAGYEPSPRDLNNTGLVVGVSQGIHSLDAVVWRNGVGEALPRFKYADGAATAVNDAGQIVGITYAYWDTSTLATLWQDGQVYDLNDLLVNGQGSYDLTDAFDINAFGQILAQDGVSGRVVLLTPVPEPSTYALLGFGLVSLALVRRQRSAASGTA
ncbi:MAG: PEP-CTERM sorting domain-containing protein [Rubrivivax sp.]|nr:MAG: PEP-CTERM sorting domain-containing protein [Rubrivivax sp.]